MTYPIILTNLEHRRCVVVGGGRVAERKVAGLLEAGARPLVVSPALTIQLAAWAAEGLIMHTARLYEPGDVSGALLVFAATDDPATNRAIAIDAERAGALVNTADDGDAGDFHTAATVRRGNILFAVSTNGASPALAAHIRRELEQRYGEEYGTLAALLRAVREGPLGALSDVARTRFWKALQLEPLLELLRVGDQAAAERLLHGAIASCDDHR